MNAGWTILASVLLSILATQTHGAASGEWPFDKWYHPGKFVPHQMTADSESVVPVFPEENSGTALRDDQKLVVLDGASAGEAGKLFVGQEKVFVNATIAGEPVAWEAADAVVFGRTVPDGLVNRLLANGTVVVVAGSRPMQVKVAGPIQRIDSEIYRAARLSPVGRPDVLKRQVLLLLCLVALAIVAGTLLRRPGYRLAVVVVVSVISAGGLAVWAHENQPVTTTRFRVIVDSKSFRQQDDWTFVQSPGELRATADTENVGWPVLPTEADTGRVAVTHTTKIDYLLDRAKPLAFLRRTISPRKDEEADNPNNDSTDPSLRTFAAVYRDANTKLVATDASSRTILLRRDLDK